MNSKQSDLATPIIEVRSHEKIDKPASSRLSNRGICFSKETSESEVSRTPMLDPRAFRTGSQLTNKSNADINSPINYDLLHVAKRKVI